MTTVLASRPTLAFRSALTAGILGGVVAAAINVVIYYLFQNLNRGPLVVQGEPLPLFAVLLSSLLPGLTAGVIYWALARFTNKPARWFLIVAGVVFVLFIFGPLTQATGLELWALELMHLGAALPIIWAVLRLRS